MQIGGQAYLDVNDIRFDKFPGGRRGRGGGGDKGSVPLNVPQEFYANEHLICWRFMPPFALSQRRIQKIPILY